MNDKENELRDRERERRQSEWEAKLRDREEKQKRWEARASKSKSHADYVVKLASSSEPVGDSALGDVILTLATGGLYAITEALKSPKEIFNEKISYLKSCSKKLNEARGYFNSHKNEMIAEDKEYAYSAIASAENKIRSAWAELNNQKQRAWEEYKNAKEEKARENAAKKAAWEERQRIKAENKRIYEEKKRAWEERQRIRAQKQKEWEERKKERERKQLEWEERNRERERKRKEWEERQRQREIEREQKQREWENRQREWQERQRERERRQQEWEERKRERERRKEEYESRKRSGGRKSRGGCYITTAVCQSLAKPDNCFELNAIRKFRDNWLKHQEDGNEIVENYYRLAPLIVEKINNGLDSDRIYLEIWNSYLKQFFEMICGGKNEMAKKIYLNMVDDLSARYL